MEDRLGVIYLKTVRQSVSGVAVKWFAQPTNTAGHSDSRTQLEGCLKTIVRVCSVRLNLKYDTSAVTFLNVRAASERCVCVYVCFSIPFPNVLLILAQPLMLMSAERYNHHPSTWQVVLLTAHLRTVTQNSLALFG